jgi:hypothetical protein
MPEPKTHFEQVPLEIVKKIVEIQSQEDSELDRDANDKSAPTSTPSVDSEELCQ